MRIEKSNYKKWLAARKFKIRKKPAGYIPYPEQFIKKIDNDRFIVFYIMGTNSSDLTRWFCMYAADESERERRFINVTFCMGVPHTIYDSALKNMICFLKGK